MNSEIFCTRLAFSIMSEIRRAEFAASIAGPEAGSSVLDSFARALDDAGGKLAAHGGWQEQIDAGVAGLRTNLAREVGELAGGNSADLSKPL